jgi:hypothetical protein
LGHGDIRPVYANGALGLIYNLSYGAVVDGLEIGTFEDRERGVNFSTTELRTVIPMSRSNGPRTRAGTFWAMPPASPCG